MIIQVECNDHQHTPQPKNIHRNQTSQKPSKRQIDDTPLIKDVIDKVIKLWSGSKERIERDTNEWNQLI
jgi:hypothetical protein